MTANTFRETALTLVNPPLLKPDGASLLNARSQSMVGLKMPLNYRFRRFRPTLHRKGARK
jgi:hypothetical protein